MEAKKNKVVFVDCSNAGQEIDALVNHFTGSILGEFVLERALEELKVNNAKMENYKQTLLK